MSKKRVFSSIFQKHVGGHELSFWVCVRYTTKDNKQYCVVGYTQFRIFAPGRLALTYSLFLNRSQTINKFRFHNGFPSRLFLEKESENFQSIHERFGSDLHIKLIDISQKATYGFVIDSWQCLGVIIILTSIFECNTRWLL